MIYRTLHSYILAELLRVFLQTAAALTLLMAFGGMFKPLMKQGLDASQMLVVLFNLMPAMMAYAIPISALFAAVLVYWRMSTDNELTACRAGGISFISLVMPAFALGLIVASADLVFLNYVVPHFLQATERAVVRDLGGLIVGQITHQEKFQYDKYVVGADYAESRDPPDENTSVVILRGMALTQLDKKGRPTFTAVAQEATLFIRANPLNDSAEIEVKLINGTGYDPGNAFRKVAGSIEKPLILPIPSYFKSKPKFLNWVRLQQLSRDPWSFPEVAEALRKVESAYKYDYVGQNIITRFESQRTPARLQPSITLEQRAAGRDKHQVTIFASSAVHNLHPPEQPVTFLGTATAPVRIEESVAGKVRNVITCQAADLSFATTFLSAGEVTATLNLRGKIVQTASGPGERALQLADKSIGALILDNDLVIDRQPAPVTTNAGLIAYARTSKSEAVRDLGANAERLKDKLYQRIDSELNSRGSFALSCLTLVLFGAALGILLRGKNPLAVFVLGFVPAVILVLLITAGRQVTEGQIQNVRTGITMIWTGNAVLLVLVAGVYFRLLRR
jgi:lipopolysaccharide export LptBFGC system permease protein LptF